MGCDWLSNTPATLTSLGDVCTHPFHHFSFCKIDSIKACVMGVNHAAIAVYDPNVYPVLMRG
jgi:hypothetical protein